MHTLIPAIYPLAIGASAVILSIIAILKYWPIRLAQAKITQSQEVAPSLTPTVVSANPNGILVLNGKGDIQTADSISCDMFGYSINELIGRSLLSLLSLPQPAPLDAAWLQTQGLLQNLVGLHQDGSHFPLQLSVSPLELQQQALYICVLRNMAEQQHHHQQLIYLAHHDHLTGLLNRAAFELVLHRAIMQAKHAHRSLALLFLDLDDFKAINDTLGHDIGDLVIQQLAQRLKDCLRETDTIARIGGDEFIILLEHIKTPSNAQRVSQKLVALFDQPFKLHHHEVKISSSIGIALYPHDADNAKTLLKQADMAMYQDKAKNHQQRCA